MAVALHGRLGVPSLKPLLLLAGISFWWAVSYVLLKLAVADIPPITVAVARLLIASLLLTAWSRLRRLPVDLDRGLWVRYGVVALIGQAAPTLLIAWAMTIVSVAEAAIIVATTPIFAAAFSSLSSGGPNVRLWIGVVIGFIGLAGIMVADGASISEDEWLARAALLAAAVGFAVAGRIVGQMPMSRPPVTGAAVTGCAALFLLPACIVFGRPWTLAPTGEAIAATVALGTVSTAIVYVSYYYLINISGAAFASLHHYIVPSISFLLGKILLDEEIGFSHVLFGVLIIFGIAVSFHRKKASAT